MENTINDELQRDYNITGVCLAVVAHISCDMKDSVDVSIVTALPGTAFYNDLLSIFRALHIVTNNAIPTVGRGGTPDEHLDEHLHHLFANRGCWDSCTWDHFWQAVLLPVEASSNLFLTAPLWLCVWSVHA